MIKEAFDWIKDHGKIAVLNINALEGKGVKYSDRKLSIIEPKEPQPLELSSLDGLLTYIENEHSDDELVINVLSTTKVIVKSKLNPIYRHREFYAVCNLPSFLQFNFNDFMSIQEFIIGVSSKFVQTERLKSVIRSVSFISSNIVTTSNDDGVTQSVATKNEINRFEKVELDPIVGLQPYRTFPEVLQPESKFLLRIKRSEAKDDRPNIALFDADGGRWKIDAIGNVGGYLRSAISNEKHIVVS